MRLPFSTPGPPALGSPGPEPYVVFDSLLHGLDVALHQHHLGSGDAEVTTGVLPRNKKPRTARRLSSLQDKLARKQKHILFSKGQSLI